MNTLDCHVIKILVPPHKVVDEENCTWKVKVEYSCWGSFGTKIFLAPTKTEIEKYKPGHVFYE